MGKRSRSKESGGHSLGIPLLWQCAVHREKQRNIYVYTIFHLESQKISCPWPAHRILCCVLPTIRVSVSAILIVRFKVWDQDHRTLCKVGPDAAWCYSAGVLTFWIIQWPTHLTIILFHVHKSHICELWLNCCRKSKGFLGEQIYKLLQNRDVYATMEAWDSSHVNWTQVYSLIWGSSRTKENKK